MKQEGGLQALDHLCPDSSGFTETHMETWDLAFLKRAMEPLSHMPGSCGKRDHNSPSLFPGSAGESGPPDCELSASPGGVSHLMGSLPGASVAKEKVHLSA